MTKKSVIFPGQGSQSKNMGKDFFEKFDIAKKMFENAKKASIYSKDYAKLCFEGSEEELQMTINTQPAIYLVSSVIFEILKSNCSFSPEISAGHSLGEYGALFAAGVFSFEEGLILLENRAKFMDECAKKSNGTMAAVMGVDENKLLEYFNEAGGIIGTAGYNSPGQIVISGETVSVKKVIELVKLSGSGKCIELKVSGAWHSDLMKNAQDKLATELNKFVFNQPKFPVISNLTAKPHNQDPGSIKSSLINQLCSPVRWIQSVEFMINEFNISEFVESGSGKVLTGLIKRINSNVRLININSVDTLSEYLNK